MVSDVVRRCFTIGLVGVMLAKIALIAGFALLLLVSIFAGVASV